MLTNSLILDDIPFAYAANQKFRLIIRTGGTIKPGVYKSSRGEVGLSFFIPSIYTQYVNDSLGDVTVSIISVSNNIVKGTFSGLNANATPISDGSFSCRVKNYQPQPELLDRWQFSFDEHTLLYNCYGGNITSAVKTQVGGRHLITLKRESDNHQLVYKLVLSSDAPLTTGLYRSSRWGVGPNLIDSAYFRSNERLWNGNTTYLYSDFGVDTWCRIESIDANQITGTLFGKLRVFYSSNSFSQTDIKLGSFKARF